MHPEILADYTARCCYWTYKMMVDLECLEGLLGLHSIPLSWDYEMKYRRPPMYVQLAMNMPDVKMLDYNILIGFGFPYCPWSQRL